MDYWVLPTMYVLTNPNLYSNIWLTIAGVFYNVKNWLSFITSKSSSENLSNHNKHLSFCCLQDKTWIKNAKMNYFFNIITSVYFDYWDFLTDVKMTIRFWRCKRLQLLIHFFWPFRRSQLPTKLLLTFIIGKLGHLGTLLT